MGRRRRSEWDADTDRDVSSPGQLERSCDEASSVFGVSVFADDETDIELRAPQQEGERPEVVDVNADVGVEDGRNSALGLWHADRP